MMFLLLAVLGIGVAAKLAGGASSSPPSGKKTSSQGQGQQTLAPAGLVTTATINQTEQLRTVIAKIVADSAARQAALDAQVRKAQASMVAGATAVATALGATAIAIAGVGTLGIGAAGLAIVAGLSALGHWYESQGENVNDQGWIDNAVRLIQEQTDKGFIPGSFLGTINGDGPSMPVETGSQYFDGAEAYAKSLGEFGISRLDAVDAATKASLLELGQYTKKFRQNAIVSAVSDRVANSIYGELFGEGESGYIRNHFYPSMLAGTVAALAFKKDIKRSQQIALGAHDAWWKKNQTTSDIPTDGHLYSLAAAWDAAKKYT